MNDLPIGDYALLSDCRSAALVSRGGSVDWLCAPRFASPSIFGRLLDADAGHWSTRPIIEATARCPYLPETMALETTFRTPTGTLRLVDAMALGAGERGLTWARPRPAPCSARRPASRGAWSSRWSSRRGRNMPSSTRWWHRSRAG
jgi:GH15 family glucan-1,4-alpha-glucosidase